MYLVFNRVSPDLQKWRNVIFLQFRKILIEKEQDNFFTYSSLIRFNTLQYDVINKNSNTPPKYVTTQEIITSQNDITTHDSNS